MDTFSKLKSFFKCWKICLGHETWDSTKWHKQILKKSILTKGKAYKVSYLQSSPGITYQPFSYIIYQAIPKLPILPPWAFDWSFAQHNGLRIIWPKMRNAQSGIWLSCQNSGQCCKQKNFIILSTFSMCSALLQYSMFVGAFESLLKGLLNVGFLEWEILMNKPL